MPRLAGQITRGKTARNRLRRVDLYLLLNERPLLRRRDAPFEKALYVDVGYGAYPYTFLESADRLRRLNPHLPALGVEIDPQRVAAAQPYAAEHTHFRIGGFNLPLQQGEQVRLIRAFNVLRQYDEAAVTAAHALLASYLLPGGLLIEGTSDPFGQVWVANLLRGRGDGTAVAGGLLFSTNFRRDFDPLQFQPVLPKNLIHRMVPGQPIFEFFGLWRRAYQAALPYRAFGARQMFCHTAVQLAALGVQVSLSPKLLRRGFLLVHNTPFGEPS